MSDLGIPVGAGFVFIVGAGLLALPTSALLLRSYRRAVLRLMAVTGSRVAPPGDPGGVGQMSRSPEAGAWRRRRATHVAIAVAAALAVGVAYTGMYLTWNDLALLPARATFLTLMFAWPAIPGVWVTTDGDRRWTGVAAAVYAGAVLVVGWLGGLGVLEPLLAWALFNGPTTVVVAVFFTRSFRAVGVMVLGVALLALVGSQALWGGLESPAAVTALVEVGSALGVTDAVVLFLAVPLVGFVLAATVGWWLARRLAAWYGRHGFSDHMLLLGSMCFVFCLEYVGLVSVGDLGALATGLGLFGLLTAGTLLTYRLVIEPRAHVSRLLMLRVFDHGGESRRLLSAVAARWRHLGPVRLIGGPDLATSTVDPDEFLIFTAGRLRSLFVDSSEALRRRLASLAPVTDPDGRFRIEELFCFDTTWQAVVATLLSESDRVLVDLRGFTEERRGTLHELELIGREDAFGRTVLIIDDRTDTSLMDRIVAAAPGGGRPRVVGADPDPGAVVEMLLSPEIASHTP